MDKEKLIKIVVIIIVIIGAIIYYISGNESSSEYEDTLTSNILATNVDNSSIDDSKVEENSEIKVYVTGEVNNPGVIELEEGARIEDAIEGCGGITAQANLKNINLAYEVEDGDKIYIPNLSEELDETSDDSDILSSVESSTESSNSKSKININKATTADLTTIPGIGESTAQKIIDYRDENGKFKSIEDIKNVSGIGDSKYEKMKDYISVK